MEALVTSTFVLAKIANFLLAPVLAISSREKSKKLPKIKSQLLKLPAVDLAEKIRNRQVSLCK